MKQLFDQCQWTQCACSEVPVVGRAYCETHLAQVYQLGSALRRRNRDLRTVDRVRLVEELLNEAILELEEEGFDVYAVTELG